MYWNNSPASVYLSLAVDVLTAPSIYVGVMRLCMAILELAVCVTDTEREEGATEEIDDVVVVMVVIE